MQRLPRALNLGRATAVALGLVIGAGILAVPGLAYTMSGKAAVYAWVVDAIIVLPLLVILGYLGSEYPNAGGVASFVQMAFGIRARWVMDVVLLGTLMISEPSIALVGADYLRYVIGSNVAITAVVATLVILIASLLNYGGVQVSAHIQQILSYGLLLLLFLAGAMALIQPIYPLHLAIAPITQGERAIPSLGLVFFAYTGWELLPFMSEEFADPKRDFRITLIASFVLVFAIYMILAVAFQVSLKPDSHSLRLAPLASLIASQLGVTSGIAMALAGLFIAIVNLVSGTWSASRMVFASAREGMLPSSLSIVHMKTGTPRHSIILTTMGFMFIPLLFAFHIVSLITLLQVSGQNLFVLYIATSMAYLKLTFGWRSRVIGLISLVPSIIITSTFGSGLIYLFILLAIGIGLGVLKSRPL